MKILFIVNYREEFKYYDFLNKYKFVDYFVLNENKWRNFAFKLQKILLKEKYDLVIHWWLCWWKDKTFIGDIYLIERAFLSDWVKIFDGQKYRFIDKINLPIQKTNIITKLAIWKNKDIIYHWGNIFDLESFWVANLTNFYTIPILTFKWVSDDNTFLFENFDEEKQIEFLLNPSLKRKKKQIILDMLGENIKVVNEKFYKVLKFILDNAEDIVKIWNWK